MGREAIEEPPDPPSQDRGTSGLSCVCCGWPAEPDPGRDGATDWASGAWSLWVCLERQYLPVGLGSGGWGLSDASNGGDGVVAHLSVRPARSQRGGCHGEWRTWRLPHPYLLEVNPRYSASMELVERANGTNLFNLHMDGLAGRLPDFSFRERSHQDFVGKGVVYARRAVSIADTSRWVERGIRDVPFPGRRIDAGHPVCTVLASGSSRQACFDAISQSAATVYGEIEEEREERCGRTAHLDHRAYA